MASRTRTGPLMTSVIEPLYGAFSALLDARRRRGTLDLDLPELRIVLDERRPPRSMSVASSVWTRIG